MAQHESSRVRSAFDVFRADLLKVRPSFESWAIRQAQQVTEQHEYAQRGYLVRDCGSGLRDWVDAYRYFDVPLFAEQPEALEFVSQSIAAVSGRF